MQRKDSMKTKNFKKKLMIMLSNCKVEMLVVFQAGKCFVNFQEKNFKLYIIDLI